MFQNMLLRYGSYRKRKHLKKIVISYICVLLIPICILSGTFVIVRQSLAAETAALNYAFLKQVQQGIEKSVDDFLDISLQLSLDSDLSTIISDEEVTTDDRMAMKRYIDTVSGQLTNNLISDIYVWCHSVRYIITSTCTYEESILNQAYNLQGIGSPWQYPGNSHFALWNDNLYYIRSSSAGKKEGVVTFLMQIDQRMLKKMILPNLPEGGCLIALISKYGNNCVFLTNEEKWDAVNELNDVSAQRVQLGSNTYQVVGLTPENGDLRYVLFMPIEIYTQSVRNAEKMLFISIIVCLGLGVYLIVMASRRNYEPIRNLLEKIRAAEDVDPATENEDEWQQMQRGVDMLKFGREQLKKQIKTTSASMQTFLLSQWICGISPDINILENAGIRIEGVNYLVLVVRSENTDGELTAVTEAARQLLHTSLESIATVGSLFYNKQLVFILGCSLIQTVHNVIIYLEGEKRKVEMECKCLFSIGISDIKEFRKEVGAAYEEAVEALSCSNNNVVNYSSIKASKPKKVETLPLQLCDKFLNCLLAMDYNAASGILEEIMPRISYSTYIGMNMRLSAFINYLVNAVYEHPACISLRVLGSDKHLHNIINCMSVEELHNELSSVLLEASIQAEKQKDEVDSNLYHAVTELVHMEYNNTDLCISGIADRFGINADYLSRNFKKQAGFSLLDFIHKERLSHAVNLLQDKKLFIRDIAQRVGYLNSDTFIRTFKKHYGLTPGEYRDKMVFK